MGNSRACIRRTVGIWLFATGSWHKSYAYDGFGNLTDQNETSGSVPTLHVVYNAATNQQPTDCADANGNTIP